MINDTGKFTDDKPWLPWLIWWPLNPNVGALAQLAQRFTKMHVQIATAAVFHDYDNVYKRLNIKLTWCVWEAAC
jgi:hypothetical protein